MVLWIRSQDRKVLRINPELEIYEDNNKDILIMDTKGSTDYYVAKVLGKYKTKERALEVLDEIDEFIDLFNRKGFGNVLSDDGVHPKHTIYEMPLE